jgi:tetratricopeptide (TPR) repeat protein
LARAHGDYAAAGSWFETALARARASGDRGAEAAALNNLGSVSLTVGNHRRAADLYTQSLAVSRSLGDRRREAATLSNMGAVAHYLGETAQAEASYQAALDLWEKQGDARRAALLRCNLALLLAPWPAERERARAYAERGLAEAKALGFPGGVATALTALGWVAEGEGNLAEAVRHHEESVRVFRESEDRGGLARGLGNLGLVIAVQGDPHRGGTLLRESLEGFVALSDDEGIATSLEMLALIAHATGDVERAARLHGAAAARLEEIAIPLPAALASRHETSVTALRATLGEAAFETVWISGREMSIEQALRDAVGAAAEKRLTHP